MESSSSFSVSKKAPSEMPWAFTWILSLPFTTIAAIASFSSINHKNG